MRTPLPTGRNCTSSCLVWPAATVTASDTTANWAALAPVIVQRLPAALTFTVAPLLAGALIRIGSAGPNPTAGLAPNRSVRGALASVTGSGADSSVRLAALT